MQCDLGGYFLGFYPRARLLLHCCCRLGSSDTHLWCLNSMFIIRYPVISNLRSNSVTPNLQSNSVTSFLRSNSVIPNLWSTSVTSFLRSNFVTPNLRSNSVRACVRACVRGNLWELMETYGNFVRRNLWELMGTSCVGTYGNVLRIELSPRADSFPYLHRQFAGAHWTAWPHSSSVCWRHLDLRLLSSIGCPAAAGAGFGMRGWTLQNECSLIVFNSTQPWRKCFGVHPFDVSIRFHSPVCVSGST